MRKNISKERNLAVENESRAVTTQCGQTALGNPRTQGSPSSLSKKDTLNKSAPDSGST